MGKADKGQIDIALGEHAAFEKLTEALRHSIEAATVMASFTSHRTVDKLLEGLRHGIEAAVEISTLRLDSRWMAVAMQFEELLKRVNNYATIALNGPTPTQYNGVWRNIKDNLQIVLVATTGLYEDAARDAVQGMTRQ